jgi:hypothetical protein
MTIMLPSSARRMSLGRYSQFTIKKNKIMGKYILTSLLVILVSNVFYGQSIEKDIIGNWIKIKAERKDGSKIIDRISTDTMFLEFSFTPDEFSYQWNPHETKKGQNYSIQNDRIYVKYSNDYLVEKLSIDTLVLSEVSQVKPDHKLDRYYFVKKNILSQKHPIKLKENIPVYNKYNSPRVHKTFDEYLQTCNAGNNKEFSFKGSLVFDHKNRSINATLNFLDKLGTNRAAMIKSCLENTYLYWDFSELEDYAKAKINFVAKSFSHTEQINFYFCTENMDKIGSFDSVDFTKIDQSIVYYKNGISDLQDSLFDSAINNFSLSYKLDNIRIDAIYKRAEAFLMKGDNKKACKDWNFLISLDQELGRSKYKEYCK